jgi:hypothetical protein
MLVEQIANGPPSSFPANSVRQAGPLPIQVQTNAEIHQVMS